MALEFMQTSWHENETYTFMPFKDIRSHPRVPQHKQKNMCRAFFNKIHACKVLALTVWSGDEVSWTESGA